MWDRKLGGLECETYRKITIPTIEEAKDTFKSIKDEWRPKYSYDPDALKTIWREVESAYGVVVSEGDTDKLPSSETSRAFNQLTNQELNDLLIDIAIVKAEIDRAIEDKDTFDLFAVANAIHRRWVESNSKEVFDVNQEDLTDSDSEKHNPKIFYQETNNSYQFYIYVQFEGKFREVYVGSGESSESIPQDVKDKAKKRQVQMVDFARLSKKDKLFDLIRGLSIHANIKRNSSRFNNGVINTICRVRGIEEYQRLFLEVCPTKPKEKEGAGIYDSREA